MHYSYEIIRGRSIEINSKWQQLSSQKTITPLKWKFQWVEIFYLWTEINQMFPSGSSLCAKLTNYFSFILTVMRVVIFLI